MNFERLLTEHEWNEIKMRVIKNDPFEIVRFDKQSKVELRIGLQYCDNGIWQDNLLCYIHGSQKCNSYYGFGSPYQVAEFLELSYDYIAKKFSNYGYKQSSITQLRFAI